MEHLITRLVEPESDRLLEYAQSTPDGNLLDMDIFGRDSTFLLETLRSSPGERGWATDRLSYLPVQQPLMLENLLFRPGLTDRERSLAITRMVEGAIAEAYRRKVGELYFLCRHAETCAFAERHKFVDIGERFGLKTYRLNLLETFGV